MSKIQLKLSENRLTLDDLIRLEEGEKNMRFLRDLFARFVLGPDGEYLPEETARKVVGALNLDEVLQVKDQFMAFLGGIKERAVPPEQGGS